MLGKQLVLTHVGRDHFADLLGLEKNTEANAIDASIVGDDSQVFYARVPNGKDERLGYAAQSETARHDQHAVLEDARKRCRRVGIDLLH